MKRADGEMLERQIRAFVSFLLGHVVFDMNTAAMSHSAFAAGSTLETAFLASLEGAAPPTSEIQKWEALRSIELPWVRDLSVQQIVQLRHDAGPALEHFRASMADRINRQGRSDQIGVEAFVSDLRLQAVEVQNELVNYRRFGGRRGHLAIGRASLAFVLYGLLVDASPATGAIAAALTALATLHPPATQQRMETERLRARAPYVLVRAREILAHPRGAARARRASSVWRRPVTRPVPHRGNWGRVRPSSGRRRREGFSCVFDSCGILSSYVARKQPKSQAKTWPRPNTGSNSDFERKLQGPVCRQVVARPRNQGKTRGLPGQTREPFVLPGSTLVARET
jgi:hypothetical protein